MNATDSVSAVVVTWNSAGDIIPCLESLLRQTHHLETIVVVDNASSDGTSELVASRFPSIQLMRRTVNEGFARGNNIGMRLTDREWVLTLNPDARCEVDYVAKLLEFASGNERIGTVGGKILREALMGPLDAPQTIDSVGIEIFSSRRVRDRAHGAQDTGQFGKPERVFGICAAAALYRRRMLDDTAVNGEFFPEYFFAYYEDADLAWRGWRRGWEAWYVPEAVAHHRRGGAPVGSRFSRMLTHRNRWWMILRNEALNQTLTAVPAVAIHEILMLLRVLRYPYLVKSISQTLAHLGRAARERRSLPSINPEPPPFHRGVGFGK